ncbi:choline dehydrogenase-like flavoprotein [Bradyrhizobium sp. USDA 372]
MIFIRGAARDYDAREALGNRGWGWKDVLPYFRKMETADEDRDDQYRGGLGPQRVSALRWRHPISQDFIDSFQAAGIPFSEDLNAASHEGVAWNQGSTREGRRLSAFEAFVRPKLWASHLKFLDQTFVRHILFDQTRATGVAATYRGEHLNFFARKGIILSAGSINSPHLLTLSGIGEPTHLKKYGIVPRVESPEVGRNLMEHPRLYVLAELDIETANGLSRPIKGALALAEWAFKRSGFLSVPTAQVLAFLRSSPELAEPDLQFHLFPFGLTKADGKLKVPKANLVTILVNINHPKSTGHLELRSSDPLAPIAIVPRLLDHRDDFEGVIRGLAWVRKICSMPPFGSHVLKLRSASIGGRAGS